MADANPPALSWQITLGALVVVIGLAGSQWAMTQLQFQSLERSITINSAKTDRDDGLMRDQVKKVADELRESVKLLRDELNARRLQFVEQTEFRAYEKGMDAQIKLLVDRQGVTEQTRPTTGELQATAAALRDRIEKLYLAQASLEDWIRTRGSLPRPPDWPSK